MPNTLAQIGKAIAIKAGLEVPTTLHGNTDRTASLFYQCIRDGTFRDAYRDVDWAVIRLEYTFTTTGTDYDLTNAGGYELPQNFGRFISGTIWDRTNDRKIQGPVTPQKWQMYRSGLSGLTGMTRICRFGPHTQYIIGVNVNYSKRLLIYPDDPDEDTPNAAADPIEIAFEYLSNKIIVNQFGTSGNLGSSWRSDDDYAIIDDNVIEAAATWRLLRTLGMSYADEKEEYNALVQDLAANDAGAETLSLVPRPLVLGANTPDTGYGN